MTLSTRSQGTPKFYPNALGADNKPSAGIADDNRPNNFPQSAGVRFSANVTAAPLPGTVMFLQIITTQRKLAAAKGGTVNASIPPPMNAAPPPSGPEWVTKFSLLLYLSRSNSNFRTKS